MGAVIDFQDGQQFVGPFAGLFVRFPGEHRQEGDVVEDGQKRDQVGGLKYKADLVPAQGPQVADSPAVVEYGFTIQGDAAGGGVDDSPQALQQGGFAGTTGTEQADDFTRINVKGNVFEGVNGSGTAAVSFDEVFHANRFHANLRSPKPAELSARPGWQ